MINVFFFLLFSFPIRRRVGHAHWPCVSPATWPTPRRLFAISAGAPVRNFSLGPNKPPPGRSANNRKHKTIIRHNNSNNNKKRKIVFTTRPLFDSINIAALRTDDDLGHARKYGRAQLPTAEVSSVCKPAPTVAGQSIDRHWRHWRCWRRPDADAPAQPGPAQCHLCILHIEAAAGGCVRVLFRLRIRSSGMSNGALEKAFLL
ncbi:hypothetical protein T09_10173 [Trichinella sp. T9]|nr:hypothetical protein T09_10173 [Trichinella sp. T9]